MKSSSLRDLNVSLEELKDIARLLARKRGIKGYKSIPKDRLLSALILSKPIKKDKKPKFSKARTGKIEREFNELKHKLSKSERKEIIRNLYEIKNKKNIFTQEREKIEKSFDEIENFLPKTMYYDYDDAEYKG